MASCSVSNRLAFNHYVGNILTVHFEKHAYFSKQADHPATLTGQHGYYFMTGQHFDGTILRAAIFAGRYFCGPPCLNHYVGNILLYDGTTF
jgi:hypothetical protein